MKTSLIFSLSSLPRGIGFASAYFLIAVGATFTYDAEAAEPRVSDTLAERLVACVACHGKEGRAAGDAYYPRIAGKPAGYLYNQLVNFRDGRRRSSAMTYFVDNLPDAYLREIAAYFAAQLLPYPPLQSVNAPKAMLERGRELATAGDAARNIPACSACHGDRLTGVSPAIPGLLGLPRDYLNAQFGAWRIGARHAAAPDCMADIARGLSAEDISAVTAFLSSSPVPGNAVPAERAVRKPPLECGSAVPDRKVP